MTSPIYAIDGIISDTIAPLAPRHSYTACYVTYLPSGESELHSRPNLCAACAKHYFHLFDAESPDYLHTDLATAPRCNDCRDTLPR